jgi:hypothetical protein
MDYFEFSFGPGDLYPWHFDSPTTKAGAEVSIWAFSMGKRYDDNNELVVKIGSCGTKTSVVFGTFGTIFVEEKLGHALAENLKSRVQIIPIKVIDTDMRFVILNLLDEIECVDEARSEFTKYEPGNQMRPDKVGHYRSVYKLAIDPAKVNGADMFKVKGWVAVIVSAFAKEVIEKYDPRGCSFSKVT